MTILLFGVCFVVELIVRVSGSLTDPGVVCAGDMVTLTCTTSNDLLTWDYGPMRRIAFYLDTSTPPDIRTAEVSGVEFRTALVSVMSGQIVSTLNFIASTTMNGQTVTCTGDSVVLVIGNDAMPSVNLSLMSVHDDTNTSTLTIEWTITNGGDIPSLEITPLPLPHPPPVNTSTNTTITVLYNTNYTLTVSTSNCAGTGTGSLSFIRVDCGVPNGNLALISGTTTDIFAQCEFPFLYTDDTCPGTEQGTPPADVECYNSTVGVTVTVVCSIVTFIVGVVGGCGFGPLVVYCSRRYCCSAHEHHVHSTLSHSLPNHPPPVSHYEEHEMIPAAKKDVEIKLTDNVAYIKKTSRYGRPRRE